MSATSRVNPAGASAARLHDLLRHKAFPYDPKRPPKMDASELTTILRHVATSCAEENWKAADEAIGFVSLYGETLALPRHAGHEKHLDNLRKAVSKRSRRLCHVHSVRLLRIVRPAAADDPLKDGDEVAVIRSAHGWFDGRLAAKVVAGSGGSQVVDDEGGVHEIRRRRDVRRISR